MTCTEWNDADSQKSQFKCALRINRQTGRLQWCAGSKCIKMFVIVPVTLLPIVLIFIVLTHLELVGTVRQYQTDYCPLANDIDTGETFNLDANDRKCVAIKYTMSETIDTEDRDVFRDIRTSFIPPDSFVISPHCRDSDNFSENIDRSKISVNDRSYSYDEVIENISSVRRGRRELNATVESTKTKLADTEKHARWTQSPTSSHAFWKDEGTLEQIRKTQADVMLQYMDLSVNPCDDFYQYSCGNWEKLNPIPKDKGAYDTFEILRESLDDVIEELLTSIDSRKFESSKELPSVDFTTPKSLNDVPNILGGPPKGTDLRNKILQRRSVLEKVLERYKKEISHRERPAKISDAEMKARDLYASCMNYELLEKRGIKPLLDLLDSLGGWPALDAKWKAENFNWLNLTARLRLYNNDIFLVQWVGPDIKNSDQNIIQLDQTSLGLPTRDYFLQQTNSQYLEAYKQFMTTIMHLLGAPLENAKRTANEIIEFETELARITSTAEERANVSLLYKKMSLETLNQEVPEIDWMYYLETVLEKPVTKDENVVVFAIDYMKNMVNLFAISEQRTIANYLFWRFVRHRINNLDDRFLEAKQNFFFVLFGREESPPRRRNCVLQLNTNMGMAVGAMFVRKYFDENSKKDTLDMTHELQQSFREIINSTEWIDGPTKTLSEEKLNAMSLRIGYPDFLLSHEELNKIYKDLEIDPSKYFENTLNVLVHLTRTEQAKLGEPVNKTTWFTAPAIVNAYYSRNKNQIMFPAGILQPPFYHRYFPKSLNYGGIGVVIGHELTHGFDDKGRLFDRDGNLETWWSDNAVEQFHSRAGCLISQYGNYTVSEVGIPVDGENTQGENIADNGGIKQAFRAYKKWLAHHSDAESLKYETLPGLNETHTQLFFLNFAQVWCGAMRPEATRSKLKTAVHSPGRFRVIGTLSNSLDFAREYNCPVGSPMNPEFKCSVWKTIKF
ncbi:Neprilysin-4 [Pseudolycoriella hygida]|uniref:Neprilysin-4 n=1 Tax=Pseudolycoriella hygida TaxID=35572 RepID=A0A9Q0MU51_9DIPT|nr:Neprilysin-4 [Pseudolycoriella hygida]